VPANDLLPIEIKTLNSIDYAVVRVPGQPSFLLPIDTLQRAVVADIGGAAELAAHIQTHLLLGTAPITRNTCALLGDSRNDQAFSGGALSNGLKRTKTALHWLHWFNALNGQKLACIANYAVSGSRTSDLDGQITNLLATSPLPQFAFIWSGVNDLTNSVSALTAYTNVSAACTRLLSAGITPVVFLESGSTSMNTSGMVAALFEYNERLRGLAHTNRQIFVFDTTSTIWNPTGAAWTSTPAPVFNTGYSLDGTHPTNLAGYKLGLAFGGWFPGVILGVDSRPAAIGEFIFANNPLNAIVNGLFTTTSGGSSGGSGTLASGTVPASWSLNTGASGTSVSLATAGGAAGNVLTATITTTQASTVKLSQDVTTTVKNAAAINDIFQAGYEITVAGGTALRGINVIHEYNDGTNTFTYYDLYCQASAADGPQAFGPILCIPSAMTITTTPSGWITTRIEAVFSGAGGATISIARARFRKRLY